MQYSWPILKATKQFSTFLVSKNTNIPSPFLMQKAEELGPGLPLLVPSLLHLYLPLLGLFHLMIFYEINSVYFSQKFTIIDQELGIFCNQGYLLLVNRYIFLLTSIVIAWYDILSPYLIIFLLFHIYQKINAASALYKGFSLAPTSTCHYIFRKCLIWRK